MCTGQDGQLDVKRRLGNCPAVLAVCLLFCLTACPRQPVTSGQGLGWAAARGNAPHQLAVLPFTDRSHTDGLASLVRTSFYSHLSALPYDDMELYQVDTRLKGHGLDTSDRLQRTPVAHLGRILGADAVVFGEITEFDRVFAGVYSQLSVGAAITIYDTRSGERLWADSHVVRFHEGGLPLDILSVPLVTMRSGLNLRERIKVRAVDELCRELASRIPGPGRQIAARAEFGYEVQAGAFLDEGKARDLSATLREKGFSAFVRSQRSGPELWHRVLLGPYPDRAQAQAVQEQIRAELETDPYTYRVPLLPN